jgi:hypothetical protein
METENSKTPFLGLKNLKFHQVAKLCPFFKKKDWLVELSIDSISNGKEYGTIM